MSDDLSSRGQHRDDGTPADGDNGQASPGSSGRRTAGNLSKPGERSGGEEHSGLGRAKGVSSGADVREYKP
jgi:hypothetical protein